MGSAPRRRRTRRWRAVAAVAACVAGAVTGTLAQPAAAEPNAPTYQNPVTSGYSIDFPDPAVIQGKDGYYYAYSTGGPYDEQGASGDPLKMARSADLVHWESLGGVFTAGGPPSWSADQGYWAPDIRYIGGQYVLYYSVPNTTVSPAGFDPGIGYATASSPAGPWTPSAEPLIPPQPGPDGNGWLTVIDPAEFTDTDGTEYLYWGSYGSGIWVQQLTADGLGRVGEPTKIATERFEGAYVVHRDGWYYLMASSANCCAGPTTGYTVFAGRSESPVGPFLDRDGVDLNASRSGGTVVLAQNGSKWIGTGHSSVVTDVTGQTWLAYHAIDRNDPYLDVAPGFTMRPMLLDRLDWIDGWPTVRAGAWGSDGPQPGPVTTGIVTDRFDSADATAATFVTVQGALTVQPADPTTDAGGFAELASGLTLALAKPDVPRDLRIEADVRTEVGAGTAGVVLRYKSEKDNVRAVLDAAAGQLTVVTTTGGHATTTSAPLPAGFDPTTWHNLSAEVRGNRLTVDLTDDRLGDPSATLGVDLPQSLRSGRAGLVGSGGGDVDNAAVAPLYKPAKKLAPAPEIGNLAKSFSDEFKNSLSPAWTWVRPDPNATVTGGALRWPTQEADVVGAGQPGILLRDPPTGRYVIETKLTLDIGTDTIRNFQQGGIIVYNGDDDFLRLDVVAVGPTRIVEFGKEMIFGDIKAWGGAVIGPPSDTTWLRIVHEVDPATGEHHYQAGSSRDGETWTWGGVWTMPAGSNAKIGLTSEASLPETTSQFGPATSVFDYFRVYRG